MYRFILMGCALLLPTLVMAQGSTYKFGSNIRVNKSDSISGNVITAAEYVDILGQIDDLFSASRNLEISGTINDDAIVAARLVTIRGKVGDMVMAAGETVIIDGEIDGDLFAAGNEVRLTPNATIRGNAALAGNEITFDDASVGGWIRATGNEIVMDGTVRGYVKLYGNDFTFGDHYNPGSHTTVTTTREISREELGNPPEDLEINVEKEESWGFGLFFGIWFYVSMFITGALLILLFGGTTGDLYRFSTERYFRNTGVGLLLFIGIPIAIILLLFLILTIPLSLMLMLFYGLALFISFLLVAITLGTKSIRYFKTRDDFADYYWGLALGIILIVLLTALPYVGGIINLLLIFFGLGTLLSYIWQMRTNSI